MFDSRAYSQAFHWLYVWPFVSCFHRGKCRLLYFYKNISLTDPKFTFSLQPGSGGKPFPDILCDCCCSWAQHNIGHSTSNVEQTPSSVAPLTLDCVSRCGVTRYREQLVRWWCRRWGNFSGCPKLNGTTCQLQFNNITLQRAAKRKSHIKNNREQGKCTHQRV